MKYFNKLILSNLKINLTFAAMFLILGMSWGQVTYYSKAAATNFNDVNSWGTVTDGSGTSPASISNADNFDIRNASVMSLTGSVSVRQLTLTTGSLAVSANTLTVSRSAGNLSTLLVAGGTLNVSGGTIILNGNFSMTSGGLTQSGGQITIDGNDNNASATSCASGVHLFSITGGTINCSAGNITIVDPPVNTYAIQTTRSINLSTTSSNTAFTGTHSFTTGDGVSTTPGNTDGFTIECYASGRIPLQNLICNGGSSANRYTTGSFNSSAAYGTYIKNILTVNAASEFRVNPNSTSANEWVVGSIVNNGTITTSRASGPPVLTFGTNSGLSYVPTAVSNISGSGVFRNLVASPTASFGSVTFNNTLGVVFASPTLALVGGVTGTVSGTLTFTLGKVSTSGQTFVMGISGAAGTTSYTAGGFTSGSIFSRNWSAAGTGGVIAAGIDPTSAVARYPFVTASGAGRSAFIERTGPSAIGTIAIQYNEVAGTTPVSIVDGVYTANTRSNDNWAVSGSAPATSYELAIVAPGVYTALDNTSRLTLASGVIGTHQAGTITPGGQRVLTAAELVNTFYLAINNPTCLPPSALTSSAITSTTATISWTASASAPSSGYDYYVSTSNTPPIVSTTPTGSTSAGITTANLTLLTANTTYYFWVRSNCGAGDLSTWAGSAQFFTGYCLASSTSSASWISAFSTTGGVTNITHTAATGAVGGYADLTATSVSNYLGQLTNFSITSGGPTVGNAIWVDWNNNLIFETGERMYVSSSYGTTVTGSFSIPVLTPNGNYRMRIITDYNNSAPSNPCGNISRGEYKDFTFSVVSAPSCLAPNTLANTAITSSTASHSWVAPSPAPSVGYEWAVNTSPTPPASGTPTVGLTASSMGLTPSTTYYLHVRSDCGSGQFSSWATLSFITSPDCSTAPVLSCATPVTSGNLAVAGGLLNDGTCGFSTPGNEKLYSFTSTTAGSYTLNITNVNGGFGYIDYQFKLASAGCGAGGWTCIGDKSSVGTTTFTLAASTQYYILLDAESASSTANHTFQIDCPVACPAPVSAAATGITTNSANANWTPTSGNFIIEYGPTSTFGTPGTGATAGNVNNFVVTATNVGTKALLGLLSSTGYSYVIRLDCTGAGNGYSANSSVRTFTTTGTPPANDECIDAINLTPTPGYFTNPGLQNMANSLPTTVTASCVTTTNNKQDVWYKLTSDNDGNMGEHINLTVTPTGTSDFAIMLYGGSCGILTELDCADDFGGGSSETIVYTEVPFTGENIETRDNIVYYLRVLDYFNSNGQFNISALGSTALPVNILSFDAKSLKNKTVQLTWNVAAEVDVREYVVERSNDNRNWSAIGTVKASQKSTYGFNDNSPVSGVNYYRLAVKDVNASVAYSDIRTVNFSGKGNMALYPNPANNTLYVSGTDDKNVVVSIYNEVGQIVTTLSSNGETIRTGGIDVSQLLPGAYSIQVKGETGLTTMRFVKQ